MSKFFQMPLEDQDAMNRFQEAAWMTAVYGEQMSPVGRMYAALGLCGEAGEVAEQTKKHWRNDGGMMNDSRGEKIKEELGDAMWYIAAVATEWGLELGEVCEHVLTKLSEREAGGELRHE